MNKKKYIFVMLTWMSLIKNGFRADERGCLIHEPKYENWDAFQILHKHQNGQNLQNKNCKMHT